MRAASNLKANPDFKVNKSDLRQGFLGFYNTRFGTHPYEFIYKIAAACFFDFANQPGAPEMKFMKELAQANARDDKRELSIRSTLRFDAPTRSFEFRAPIFRMLLVGDDLMMPPPFAEGARDHLKIRGLHNMPPVGNFSTSKLGGGKIITGADLSIMMHVSAHTKECVATGIKHVEAETINNRLVLWVTFRIDSIEAEYLNNTPAREIKLGNFYPTLLDWASNVLGQETDVPKSITPISAIAETVREVRNNPAVTVRPRVGVDNMVMDINNNIYVIPEIDSAAEYEQKLMDFGLRENGVYTWGAAAREDLTAPAEGINVRDIAPGRPKLPINMPIFTDWVNDKFAYSNSAGNLAVYDLSNTVPASSFHLLKVLNSPVSYGELKDWMKVINNAVTSSQRYDRNILNDQPTHAEVQAIKEKRPDAPVDMHVEHYFRRPAVDFRSALERAVLFQRAVGSRDDLFANERGDVPYAFQFHHEQGLLEFRWIGRILKRSLEMIEGNLEAMYAVYSVMSVLQQLAILRVIVNHSTRRAELDAGDKAERDPYLNQDLDPDYEVGSVALLKKDMKFMPHQAKIDNLMRKHPKSATYAVAAGGGKTIQILTNILREIKAGVAKKCCIMCPPHLVAQYIEEVVYFFEGRLNVIPCTNVTMKAHGEEGLGKMITNMPPNTVVVADYDFIKGRSEEVAYGNKAVTVYRNAEFMRQFEFELVALDESHFLKNTASSRRDAAARFIQDIPYKRLASGTFIADTPKDVVSQIALIDPTIFGSEENFKSEFGDDVRGGKVLAWKVGYEAQVAARIREHVVYAEGKRKEWAALLPDSDERFYAVDLTENQRLLYDSILAETMELINEAMARRPELKEAMDDQDETRAEEIERMLKPYMARLERFLSAPDQDPAGAIFLKDPADHVSPKLAKMYELIQKHIDENLPGKVLVFTMYLPTAEAAYLNASDELRAKGIHYVAAEKLQARSDFESNDDKRWMVGQSSSMDTGLNLQHVSRLIRLETVWTPGVLEQGNSRINRPQIKKDEMRDRIYFDWIMVNRTVDVTKISRLISKIVSKAKFDEYDNPAYQQIEALPPTPITLESIASNNDFNEELMPYLEAYQEYEQVRTADYAQYREDHGLHTPEDIQNAMVPVPQGGMLEGSKLMSRVPYVPGMNLYSAAELGLLRYDQFVRQDIDTVDAADVEEDDEEEDIGEDNGQPRVLTPKEAVRKANRELRARERVLAKHRPVHTEYGDGEITAIGNKFVRIRLNNGERKRIEKMRVFIITRSTTNNVDMRNELLKQIGDLPLDNPITVPIEEAPVLKGKRKSKGQVEEQVEMKPSVDVDFTIINDMLFLKYSAADESDKALPVLQNLGFRVSPPYKFARMQNARVLLRLFRAWRDKEFKVDSATSGVFKEVHAVFKTKGAGALGNFGMATALKFQNFYRAEIKPSAAPDLLKVYPQIQDGQLYVMLPTQGQTGNLRAIRVPVQSVRWRDGGGKGEVLCFIKSKEEGKAILKKILEAGLEIGNLQDLQVQYKKLKLTKSKG